MKIISPLPRKRGRIEIIPLIDIMFFLLAAFMVVSINKIKVKTLKVSLPTDVPVSQLDPKEDFISVSINAEGEVQVDKDLVKRPEDLLPKLQEYYAKNKDQKFLISADKEARNGDVIAVLGKLRTAGFQKVAFNLKGGSGVVPNGGGPGDSSAAPAPAPEAPAAPAPASSTPAPTTPSVPPATTAPAPSAPVTPSAEPATAPPTPPAAAAPAAPAPETAPAAPAAPAAATPQATPSPTPPPNP